MRHNHVGDGLELSKSRIIKILRGKFKRLRVVVCPNAELNSPIWQRQYEPGLQLRQGEAVYEHLSKIAELRRIGEPVGGSKVILLDPYTGIDLKTDREGVKRGQIRLLDLIVSVDGLSKSVLVAFYVHLGGIGITPSKARSLQRNSCPHTRIGREEGEVNLELLALRAALRENLDKRVSIKTAAYDAGQFLLFLFSQSELVVRRAEKVLSGILASARVGQAA